MFERGRIMADELDYFSIGQRIRKYRRSYNMSQEELAEKVNISVTHLSHIETGNTKLSLTVLVKISEALSVSTDDILNDRAVITKNTISDETIKLLESCSVYELSIASDTLKTLITSIRMNQ